MTGGKDEKIMDPLFPRLHINDTEIGGPRAPPRNKMAVYEQLSIPSQKCSTGQGGRNESTVFPSFDIPLTTPAHSSDKLHPLSYDALYMHTTLTDLEQKFMEANYPSLYESMHLSWDTEYGSLQPHDFSNSKNASGPKLGDEDDFMVPAFIHSKITQSSSMHPHSIDKESEIKSSPSQPGCSTVILGNSMPKTATNTFSSSMQRNSRDKQLKRTNTTDLTSRQHGRNHGEENLKNSSTNKEMEKLASNSSPKENASEPLKHTNASLNQDRQSSPVENIEGGVQNIDSRLHLEYKAGFPPKNIADSNGISVDMEKRNVSRGDRESCSRSSLWNGQKSPIEAENGGNYCDEKAHKSLQVGNVDRNDDSSETSMVDSTSGLEISPDDVVGAIGQKHFWKARRAMANQQRLFAVQVFELHRLIKVQRLIAGSPNLLLQDPYLSKPSLKVSPPKMLPSEKVLKYPPQIKAKDESQRPKQGPESAVGTASGDLNKQRVTQNSSYGPYSGSLPPLPVATENKTVPPWYFHPPPGNQWLLPIMSPTEGLVYKPFSGAFPPTAGFMPPIYGDWGPMTVPSMAGGCLNPAFGIPGLAPVAQVYLPVMNVVNFASPFEGGSSYAGTWPDKQAEKLSTEKINHNMRVNPSHVLRRPGNTKLNYKRRQ